MKNYLIKNDRIKIFSLAICYFLYKYKKSKFNTLHSFNDLDDVRKKNLTSKNNDLFIWGNGVVLNNSSIYTNFHPHRINSITLGDNNQQLDNSFIDVSFGENLTALIDKYFNLYVWREPKLNSEKLKSINNHSREGAQRLAKGIKVISTKFTKDKLFILDKKGFVYFYNIETIQPRSEDFFITGLPEPKVNLETNNLIYIKELKDIIQIETGGDHFIALDKHGKIFGMGDDSFGQLGQGNFSQEREEQMKLYSNFIQRRERLPKLIPISEKITKVVCGENHTLALSEGGNVYGFGYNRYLQLSNDPLYRQGLIGLNKPTLISSEKFRNFRIVDIAASKNCSYFTCKDDKNGTFHFFSAGEGLKGQLGQNLIKHLSDIDEMPDISGLINAESLKPFEPLKLKCGLNHCLLLFKNPRILYVWGNNEYGELGTKDRVFYESPVPMLEEYMLPFKILNIQAGYSCSSFICEKVDKAKRKQILDIDQKNFSEEMDKKKKKRKIKKPQEELPLRKEEEQRNFSISEYLKNMLYELKKYI
jgi:alpha-tubulin suppressor-like RCC1 family protein